MIVEKKIWPKCFGLLKSGKKNFELRLGDFDIGEGDTLILNEWDPETKSFTGRKIEKKVKSAVKVNPLKFFSIEKIEKHGLQVIELGD